MTDAINDLPKVQAKTARGKRFLDSRAPQTIESVKSAIFCRSSTTSLLLNNLLHDLYSLKKPNGVLYTKRNEGLRPFEDAKTLEFFGQKSDATFAFIASHSKKRPDCLTFARFFDGRVMDMVELAITNYHSIVDWGCSDTVAVGSKPCFAFMGGLWEQDADLWRLKEMIIDCFRGEEVKAVDLSGLQTVISVMATSDGRIGWRVYRISHERIHDSSEKQLSLEPMGPDFDARMDRRQWATEQLVKETMRRPKELKPKKIKNVEHDELGHKYGHIHVGKQDLSKLQTRKMKGLKK